MAIRENADGDADNRVEDRKSQPMQQAELRVADLEIGPYRTDEKQDDRPVHIGKRVGQSQKRHRGPGRRRVATLKLVIADDIARHASFLPYLQSRNDVEAFPIYVKLI